MGSAAEEKNFRGKEIRPTGLEPVTPRSEVWCSIQLSYGRVWMSEEITEKSVSVSNSHLSLRTQNLLNPGASKQTRKARASWPGSMACRAH